MRSKHRVADCLAHIVENADRIDAYVAGVDRAGFGGNAMVRDAVERCLERVCEASHRLGEQAEQLMPDQPWHDIRGMGNQLRHAYDRISIDVIWQIVSHDLPRLSADARRTLLGLDADPAS